MNGDAREQIARALAGAGVMVAQALNPEDLARIVLAVPAVAEALAAVERVRALAEEWDSEHPAGCCASGVCMFDDGRHTDPADPIRVRELLGIWNDNPPPMREHRTIPCPGECSCKIGPRVAALRRALDGEP